jgi:dTDP-4-amino-4,6-dideoxygalactose transaminase
MEVRLLDLKRQYEEIREELEAVVAQTFADQAFVLGERVATFEKAMADYCGTAGAVGVASGTDALLIGLRALGVENGEEVITTPYTFFATAGAVWNAGGKPVFVDIDPATFNIDADRIEAAITEKTRVICPVHLFGQVADMDPILAVAEKHGVAVLEDAAQAIGAEYQGKRAGQLGDLGAFSFFPSKNLGGAGDGGMIVGDDEEMLDTLRRLRGHGAMGTYIHSVVGWNSRLDALQAEVLGVKLRHLDAWSALRREHAAIYDEAFLPMEEVAPPVVLDGCTPIYNQYVIRAARRDELKAFLGEHGIGSAIYYPLSLHEQECFLSLGYSTGDMPESERAAKETLSLPVYAELTEGEQAFVIEKIREFYTS